MKSLALWDEGGEPVSGHRPQHEWRGRLAECFDQGSGGAVTPGLQGPGPHKGPGSHGAPRAPEGLLSVPIPPTISQRVGARGRSHAFPLKFKAKPHPKMTPYLEEGTFQ